MSIKRVSVTICFDVEGVDDDSIYEVLTDMFHQTETLEDTYEGKVLWSNIETTSIVELED